jgi:hypothetical protein
MARLPGSATPKEATMDMATALGDLDLLTMLAAHAGLTLRNLLGAMHTLLEAS